jgi:hypothetical protein
VRLSTRRIKLSCERQASCTTAGAVLWFISFSESFWALCFYSLLACQGAVLQRCTLTSAKDKPQLLSQNWKLAPWSLGSSARAVRFLKAIVLKMQMTCRSQRHLEFYNTTFGKAQWKTKIIRKNKWTSCLQSFPEKIMLPNCMLKELPQITAM